jgi:hypothetical protein
VTIFVDTEDLHFPHSKLSQTVKVQYNDVTMEEYCERFEVTKAVTMIGTVMEGEILPDYTSSYISLKAHINESVDHGVWENLN